MNRRIVESRKLVMFGIVVWALSFVACSTANAKGKVAAAPDAKELQQLVNEAHAKFKDVKDGKNANYHPHPRHGPVRALRRGDRHA